MDLTDPTGPLGDPFWDTVIARHPDATVVILPSPEDTESDDTGPDDPAEPVTAQPVHADRAEIEQLVAVTRDTAAALWEAITDEAAGEQEAGLRRAPGADPQEVLLRGWSRVVRRDAADGPGAMERLATELSGWWVRQHGGPVARLHAVRSGDTAQHADDTVQASYAESSGLLVLEVTSRPARTTRSVAAEFAGGQ